MTSAFPSLHRSAGLRSSSVGPGARALGCCAGAGGVRAFAVAAHGRVSLGAIEAHFRQSALRWPGIADFLHDRQGRQTHRASMRHQRWSGDRSRVEPRDHRRIGRRPPPDGLDRTQAACGERRARTTRRSPLEARPRDHFRLSRSHSRGYGADMTASVERTRGELKVGADGSRMLRLAAWRAGARVGVREDRCVGAAAESKINREDGRGLREPSNGSCGPPAWSDVVR